MAFSDTGESEKLSAGGELHHLSIEGIGEWALLVPATVYPPREDTILLCEAIAQLQRRKGSAVEIGCGSGAVTIALASFGWSVTCCDINPLALSATRRNLEKYGMLDQVEIIDSGIGEGFKIPEDASMIVWNLPYLDPANDESVLSTMEEAALNDIKLGGWGKILLDHLSEPNTLTSEDCLILILFRTDPRSQSSADDWREKGWSVRSVASKRLGGEKLEVFAMWKPGTGIEPTIIDECDSTMDEAASFEGNEWNRVFVSKQRTGRGRRGAKWWSTEGSISATWSLDPSVLDRVSPGLLQTSIGAIVAGCLQAQSKWPNDIVTPDGKKMGGVLIECSDNENVRIGIGVNCEDFQGDGFVASGWASTLGDVGANQVLSLIDAALASFFEDNGWLKMPTSEEMLRISWKGLSTMLSRGVSMEVDGIWTSAVGLTLNGELEVLDEKGSGVVNEMDGVRWAL